MIELTFLCILIGYLIFLLIEHLKLTIGGRYNKKNFQASLESIKHLKTERGSGYISL